MRKHTRTTPSSNLRTQLADYFGVIAGTQEWNPDAWRALCTRLQASGTPLDELTLRQIHDCIHEIREGDHARSVLPPSPRHPAQAAPEYAQGERSDSFPNRPIARETRRASVSAEITLRVSENSIILAGALDMGGLMVRSTRGWRRIENGWTLTSGPVFFRDHEDLLGQELAEYLGDLPLPLTLADALREPRGSDEAETVED